MWQTENERDKQEREREIAAGNGKVYLNEMVELVPRDTKAESLPSTSSPAPFLPAPLALSLFLPHRISFDPVNFIVNPNCSLWFAAYVCVFVTWPITNPLFRPRLSDYKCCIFFGLGGGGRWKLSDFPVRSDVRTVSLFIQLGINLLPPLFRPTSPPRPPLCLAIII